MMHMHPLCLLGLAYSNFKLECSQRLDACASFVSCYCIACCYCVVVLKSGRSRRDLVALQAEEYVEAAFAASNGQPDNDAIRFLVLAS
ncbi:hypothetical protein RHSIM_Rhsim07G0068900 [Rhododendron simsii]|uniref:Uncharacterized protein n=1 Tax=Rhododendron simsii TaxID=118357 RepID=A0A834LKZ4_RHOSS|nr:hypothetical protein RHSIM_Rhsim07G0068900 [Rhododendron simsii]